MVTPSLRWRWVWQVGANNFSPIPVAWQERILTVRCTHRFMLSRSASPCLSLFWPFPLWGRPAHKKRMHSSTLSNVLIALIPVLQRTGLQAVGWTWQLPGTDSFPAGHQYHSGFIHQPCDLVAVTHPERWVCPQCGHLVSKAAGRRSDPGLGKPAWPPLAKRFGPWHASSSLRKSVV